MPVETEAKGAGEYGGYEVDQLCQTKMPLVMSERPRLPTFTP